MMYNKGIYAVGFQENFREWLTACLQRERKRRKMRMSLRARMLIGFLTIAILTGGGFGVTILNLNKMVQSSENIEKIYFSNYEKYAALALNVERQVSLYRMYALTGSAKSVEQFKKLAAENETIEEALIASAVSDRARELSQEIRQMNREYSDCVIGTAIPIMQSGDSAGAHAFMLANASPIVAELTKKIDEAEMINKESIQAQMRNAADDAASIHTLAIVLSIVIFILSVGIGLLAAWDIATPIRKLMDVMKEIAAGDLTRKNTINRTDEIGMLADEINGMTDQLKILIKKIQNSSEQVAASAEELTAGADQSAGVTQQIAKSVTGVSEMAVRQSDTVNSSTAVISRISSEIEDVAVSINHEAEQTEKAVSAASAGNATIDGAVRQMNNIERTVEQSAQRVMKLGHRSKEIGQIVDTISGIAGQTNLLALNAAIEAARAGEQGKGFAVVAEEVRKLAEQSQEAAKQIEVLITEIQRDTDEAVAAMSSGTQEVRNGTEAVNEAGQSFVRILETVNVINEQSVGIAKTIDELAVGTRRIVSSIQEIDQVGKEVSAEAQSVSAATEEQAASMQEIAASSRALSILAQELHGIGVQFKI